MLTILLAIVMMAGLFVMLWAAVGFIQDKRLFSSAPKEGLDVIRPKPERFRGQHVVGWCMMALALVLLVGPVVFGAYNGIMRGFRFGQFFLRFAVMLLLVKAYDILFFDWVLLCHSGFFPHYFPELKGIYGPHTFGYNKRSHAVQAVLMLLGSALLAWICTLLVH